MDAIRRREARSEALSVFLSLLAGLLLVGSVLALSTYNRALLHWASQGLVETSLVVAGAVAAILVILALMLIGFACCRNLPTTRE